MKFKDYLDEASMGSYGKLKVTRMQLDNEANDLIDMGKSIAMVTRELEKKYELKKVIFQKKGKGVTVVNIED